MVSRKSLSTCLACHCIASPIELHHPAHRIYLFTEISLDSRATLTESARAFDPNHMTDRMFKLEGSEDQIVTFRRAYCPCPEENMGNLPMFWERFRDLHWSFPFSHRDPVPFLALVPRTEARPHFLHAVPHPELDEGACLVVTS